MKPPSHPESQGEDSTKREKLTVRNNHSVKDYLMCQCRSALNRISRRKIVQTKVADHHEYNGCTCRVKGPVFGLQRRLRFHVHSSIEHILVAMIG